MSFRVDSYALGTKKLAVARSFGTKEAGRLEVGMDDQQAMVVEISDDNVAFVVEADSARGIEMLPQRSFKAVLVDENT